MYNKIYQVGVALCLMGASAVAQQTAWQDVNSAYKSGLELFERGKYSSAAKQFDRAESVRTKSTLQLDETQELTLLKENIRYYQAVCALELEESNAESLFLKYIRDFPSSANSKAANFQIGKFYYTRQEFEKAIEWFT
ncbi:hypothetical protein M8994_21765, partial [Brucella sp. 21LCYQ03]|nr:hypothetical protein [Brucella sp. 21LCYQ03]